MGDLFADSPERGVYRTTDGGKTWTQDAVRRARERRQRDRADPKDPNVLYAGMWQFRRLPWTFTSGGAADGIYKSTDGGETWTRLSGHGLPARYRAASGWPSRRANPQRVYALIESKAGILWRSDDAGATWTLVSNNTLVDQRPFYFSHLPSIRRTPTTSTPSPRSSPRRRTAARRSKRSPRGVHVDYHAMWIAPNDPARMIVGEDGGYALTLDGGADWSFSRNLPIGQIYHVGYDDRTPYSVCVGLQDNNGFCGPSNSLNAEGIPDDAWDRVVGGDGQWAWPDPRDPNLVWTDLQTDGCVIYDRSGAAQHVRAAVARDVRSTTSSSTSAKYRFNWDSPIALSPLDPATTWFGGNVVFATRDRGQHWTLISPDLTRNDKAHQQPAGGPIALDVSGAEYTGTMLDIEGSPKTRGEIWTGSDDGLVQLTRDGGEHWAQRHAGGRRAGRPRRDGRALAASSRARPTP